MKRIVKFILGFQEPHQPYVELKFANGDEIGAMVSSHYNHEINVVKNYLIEGVITPLIHKAMLDLVAHIISTGESFSRANLNVELPFDLPPEIIQSEEQKADEARIGKERQLQSMTGVTIAPSGIGRSLRTEGGKLVSVELMAPTVKYIIGTDWCKPGYDDYNAATVCKVTETGEGVILEVITERDPKAFEKRLEALKDKYQPNTEVRDK